MAVTEREHRVGTTPRQDTTTESQPPEPTKKHPGRKSTSKKKEPPGGIVDLPLSLGVFLVGLVADLLTKLWAIHALRPDWWPRPPSQAAWDARPEITIIPGFFRFVYAENEGAAFSILYGHVTLLALISLVASIGLIWFWYSLPAGEKWGRLATILILSGAVGNLFDRAFRGSVVDFIDVYIVLGGESHHWPTFNIADSCICVGAGILAWRLLAGKI